MNQFMNTVMEVLQELRIDLQDFAWLVAQQLRIDSTLLRVSDQVCCNLGLCGILDFNF